MSDLERIERYARHLRNDAIQLTGAVRILRARPEFETNAEDRMREAYAELAFALTAVRSAMKEFNAKPVEHV
jgi:hypothetical protein